MIVLLPILLILLSSCGDSASEVSQQAPPPPPSPPPYLDFQSISLDNLDAFQATDGNWTVAGSAYTDRTVEKGELSGEAGTGVLLNNNTEEKKSHLVTTESYGDLEVDLEFMMAKGSNSGVYLQGRYEVQLFDSWGVENPGSNHVGGIYQRWDETRPEGQKGYEGHPPRMNAARAPGLWQHLRIRFQAPRFDAAGKKTENARFISVVLNGIEVQKDAEVSGPTRAAMFEDEQATGPLMIQGDHGPLAIRNLSLKAYGDQRVTLSDLSYSFYEIDSNPTTNDSLPDFSALTAAESGKTDSLSRNLIEARRNFGLVFEGTIDLPASGNYMFLGQAQGGFIVTVGGKEVLNHDGEHEFVGDMAYQTTELTAGKQPFQLRYRKQHRAWKNGLALYVEGPGIPKMSLHAPGSPMYIPERKPLAVDVDPQEVSTIRGYVMHDGMKHTHSMSVGYPAGTHFSYDLNQGAWLTVWSGDFLDVREMWAGRGVEQIGVPMGAALELGGLPSFAKLANKNAAWPDSIYETDPIQFDGYELTDDGAPTFLYSVGSGSIADQILPSNTERKLTRNITASNLPPGVWLLLASGDDIQQLPDGSYAINGQSYYLESSAKAMIRSNAWQQELLISLSDNPTINYSLIW